MTSCLNPSGSRIETIETALFRYDGGSWSYVPVGFAAISAAMLEIDGEAIRWQAGGREGQVALGEVVSVQIRRAELNAPRPDDVAITRTDGRIERLGLATPRDHGAAGEMRAALAARGVPVSNRYGSWLRGWLGRIF